MIWVFEKNETTNHHIGYGIIKPYSCVVHEEKNGNYSVTMEIEKGDTVCELERILYCPTPKHGYQEFRIYDIDEQETGLKTVLARHVFYDLQDNFLDDIRPTNDNGNAAIQKMLAGLQFQQKYTGSSNIESLNTAYWQMTNPVEALIGEQENSFINRWGGVLDRDNYSFTINDDEIKVVDIIYSKNLEQFGLHADSTEIVTRIMPTGLKSDGQTVLKLPEIYIDSPRINDYIYPKIQRIHYSDIRVGESEGDYATEDEAFAALRERAAAEFAAGIDLPKVSGTVSIVDLAKTKEYANAKGLETITPFSLVQIWISGKTITAEMQEYDFDALSEQYVSITIGMKNKYVGETMETQLHQLAQKVDLINNKISNAKGV